MHIHHDHVGGSPSEAPQLQEIKSLLAYMIHHNDHHAQELAALLDSLPTHARKKLLMAIGSFEAANVELQGVLDSLE